MRPAADGLRAWLRLRRPPLAALGLGVLLVHLWLVDRHWPAHLGDGAFDRPLRRIDVSFVRELGPSQPATAMVPPPTPAPRLAALRPLPAASAAERREADLRELPEPPEPPEPRLPPQPPMRVESLPPVPAEPLLAVIARAAPVAAASAAAAASAPAGFEWPPSTRLSYTLSGDFRGPVQGQAKVEWLRSGSRYQVHLELSVGPSFAPLMSRRITSEGEITAAGLEPRRYDEETRIALRDPRRLTIWLDADRVRLPGGADLPRPAGVQDSASQFVQMTWLYTMQPGRLQPGQSVELPLALPRRVETWQYDVQQMQTLDTPAGPIETVHVKPRREGRPGDLTAEFWVAPSLQYLPVRILIRQDAQSYVDLLIERLPQQADRGR